MSSHSILDLTVVTSCNKYIKRNIISLTLPFSIFLLFIYFFCMVVEEFLKFETGNCSFVLQRDIVRDLLVLPGLGSLLTILKLFTVDTVASIIASLWFLLWSYTLFLWFPWWGWMQPWANFSACTPHRHATERKHETKNQAACGNITAYRRTLCLGCKCTLSPCRF